MRKPIAEEQNIREQTIQIDDVEPVLVLGFQDEHLTKIENTFPDVQFTVRGNSIKVKGPEQELDEIRDVIQELETMAGRNGDITESDIDTVIALSQGERKKPAKTNPLQDKSDSTDNFILHSQSGEKITAKTPGQKEIVKASEKNDIVFAIGPAGTGKTFTSVALAVRALKSRQAKKIILARPAVEAGETLGFLPGDLREKIDPYLRPLYDALEEMIEYDRLELHLAKNVIEIAPLAYMRGRTLNNAFVILDEAQNATNMQMKMFLTRIGFNSKAIITGDVTQTDLPQKRHSGLISIQEILKDVKGIRFVYLDQNDVVRHRLVREIIDAYNRHEDKNDRRT
ncbi:MAG: PhoH family protein [Balneolaceae bacterium]|nr:PhoH family protein [Balneolaceae bacterium]